MSESGQPQRQSKGGVQPTLTALRRLIPRAFFLAVGLFGRFYKPTANWNCEFAVATPGNLDYTEGMLQYHVGFYMPRGEDRMVVAEVLDFPGVVSQGFDLADARAMIASALEDMAESYLEGGRPLPPPSATATDPEADLVELIPLSVATGVMRPDPARPTSTKR